MQKQSQYFKNIFIHLLKDITLSPFIKQASFAHQYLSWIVKEKQHTERIYLH